jgi:hypothetical protein
VRDPGISRWRQHQWQGQRASEKLNRCVDIADISKNVWAKAKPAKRRRVPFESALIFRCAIDVIKDTSRKPAPSDPTQIFDIGAARKSALHRIEFNRLESNN